MLCLFLHFFPVRKDKEIEPQVVVRTLAKSTASFQPESHSLKETHPVDKVGF